MAAAERVLTVTELNGIVRQVLEAEPRLARCVVTGEISNFKHHSSGHMYFTLKDEQSRVRAVMFAGRNRLLRFRPEDGMRVTVTGSVSVFDRDGSYQLYVESMQPDGVGALYVAYEQLKQRLDAEGLFSAARKRALPAYPRRVGVVTSPTGAVIRDICSTLRRRYPHVEVVLSPAQVQGPSAGPTIVRGIARLVAYAQTHPVDVVIVARGGGSIEELWPFNEEVVARAIAACPIPVVSAVGHETDFTIADFVADVRAATPTAAAELVAPNSGDVRRALTEATVRAQAALQRKWTEQAARLGGLAQAAVLREPDRLVRIRRQALDWVQTRLQENVHRPLRLAERDWRQVRQRLEAASVQPHVLRARAELQRLEGKAQQAVSVHLARQFAAYDRVVGKLEALNPLAVLRRGYSVVYAQTGVVVSSVAQLTAGQVVRIRLQDGERTARITDEGERDLDVGIQTRLDI
ncbi:MAG: exodeoxyribonuclease VII large subunit [Alicyclobacillus sp.]|nr:exodeoxyribonuclease VII large subunit [Alicyclobacillus sp.]